MTFLPLFSLALCAFFSKIKTYWFLFTTVTQKNNRLHREDDSCLLCSIYKSKIQTETSGAHFSFPQHIQDIHIHLHMHIISDIILLPFSGKIAVLIPGSPFCFFCFLKIQNSCYSDPCALYLPFTLTIIARVFKMC